MAYKVNNNAHRSRPGGLSLATNRMASANNSDEEFYEIEPAEVLDIILNDEHPDFKSIEDLGKIRARLLYSQSDFYYNKKDYSNFPWIKPLDINRSVYPLKHEVVLCSHYISREDSIDGAGPDIAPKILYYDKIINTINSVNHNALTDISITKEFKNTNKYTNPTGLNLGNTFKAKNIHVLKHNEGDIIEQGRSGNSIRFGSENGIGVNPVLILRNGQREDIDNSQITSVAEDINRDGSSIWLTSNNALDLNFSSPNKTSLNNPPTSLDGKQITLNSDRIILNSKANEIIASANKDILLTANKEVGINSNRTVVNSNNIYLGSNKASEPVVLGNELLKLLYKVLVQLAYLTVTTPAGVSSPPNNATEFTNIIKELTKILSKQNFTL